MRVVVVESPAKAKTINKYLGGDYEVLASYGHVRDLPPKDGSVLPEHEFEMLWQVDAKAKKRLDDIARAVRGADTLILATDPDREGEAISWHVLEALKEKKALKGQRVERVVFNAITKSAVLEAMAKPRGIEVDLVDAYRARRALDYLVGFNLSPVLWRKLPGARSAGRVQSVALRLVCDREAEIERFVSEEYWSIVADMSTPAGDAFSARLHGLDGKRLDKLGIRTGDEAARIKTMLEAAAYRIVSVEAKPQKRHPQPPFTTSTLQQEAARKLGFSSARTMQVAQKLYEGIDIGGETAGLITYMRTDGVQMAGEAIASIRREIGRRHGDRYLPEKPRHYATKAKNAQEAHEAIRPTDISRAPQDVRRFLDEDGARLYELVWKRAIASQMESAELEVTTVTIAATSGERKAELRATGTVIRFDGFLSVYQEGLDDDEGEEGGRLPPIEEGSTPTLLAVTPRQHFTQPPPRYTEATLIKKMEELGIGRPSTYTSTLSTLRDREYVRLDKRRLVPESKGRLVTAFLEAFFERYVEYGFTADLEERLDRISAGEIDWRQVLREFWEEFTAHLAQTKDLRVAEVLDALNDMLAPLVFPKRADDGDPRSCPSCASGRLSLKLGKFGAFVGCSNYPECNYTRQLSDDPDEAKANAEGPRELGIDPDTGHNVTLRSGRFGPYVQLESGEAKPPRASLPKGWSADDLDLDRALMLLSLPRLVGVHPETGEEIRAGIGRYGPFLLHAGSYANLESVDDVFEIGLNRAVTVIAEKKERGGARRGGATPAALLSLGDHPSLGGPVTVRDGRYGPYVNHGKVNATLPKGTDPAAVTLEEALALIEAKGGSAPAKKVSGTRKAAGARKGDGPGGGDAGTEKAKPARKAAGRTARTAPAASNGSGKAGGGSGAARSAPRAGSPAAKAGTRRPGGKDA